MGKKTCEHGESALLCPKCTSFLQTPEIKIDVIRTYFGLTKYEALAWLALLKVGPSYPNHIYTLAGIPQPRIYDTLCSLKEKGFVYEAYEQYERRSGYIHKGVKYHTFPPRLVADWLHIKIAYNCWALQPALEEYIRATGIFKQLQLIYETKPKLTFPGSLRW